MIFSLRACVSLAVGLALLPSTYALTWGFPYGSQKVRGVNIGGWLVLEVRMSIGLWGSYTVANESTAMDHAISL